MGTISSIKKPLDDLCCIQVPPKHRAELLKAIETAFENIALRRPNHDPLILFHPASRIKTVQFFVLSEEIVGVSLNIPRPNNKFGVNHSNFSSHFFAHLISYSYHCHGVKVVSMLLAKVHTETHTLNINALTFRNLVLSGLTHNNLLGKSINRVRPAGLV